MPPYEAAMPFSIRSRHRFPFSYLFGFMPLTAFLFLNSESGHAEWQSIGRSQDGMSLFVDPGSIHREGSLVELDYLFDFNTLQIKADGYPPFTSQKLLSEFDCKKEHGRFISGTDYSGHIAKGVVVFAHAEKGPWCEIALYTVDQALWAFACGKK
jgi:hypothetical protein